MDKLRRLNGLFGLNKPAGITSATLLDRFKVKLQKACGLDRKMSQRALAKLCKIGHGGTLDPMATGVMVVGLGAGCKGLATALAGRKIYRFKAKFGAHYDTYDSTGKLLKEMPWQVTREQLELVRGKFIGLIMQKPPAFSAVHIDGKRAYDLAREGKAVDIPAKQIKIDRLDLIEYDPESGEWEMDLECGGGTYVRSLIVDIAEALGTVAHMVELQRTFQAPFTLSQCLQLEDCEAFEKIASAIIKA